jgi:hypothetical protein
MTAEDSMRRILALTACAALVAGAWACGGTDSSLSDAGADGTVPNGDGGGGNDSGGGGDGGGGGDSGGGNDGSVVGDGAVGDAGNVSISCGSTTCGIADTCCVKSQGADAGAFCVTGACPAMQTALKCSKAADCAMGLVCCATIDQNNNVSSTCAATCTGNNSAPLCDPKSDAGCPPMQPCSTNNIGDWNLPNTFGTCGGKGN